MDYTDYDYVNQIILSRHDEWIEEFEKFRRANRFLEVRCGNGHLLFHAMTKNWDVRELNMQTNRLTNVRRKD